MASRYGPDLPTGIIELTLGLVLLTGKHAFHFGALPRFNERCT